MERIIRFFPAFDKRNPDPKKNYGIGSADIGFFLKGQLGCIQFKIMTGWYIAGTCGRARTVLGYSGNVCDVSQDSLMASDLGYHSPIKQYDSQETITDSCEWLDGEPCYYDGSGLNAEPILKTLVEEGDVGVWKKLEEYYINTFGELK